MTENTSETETVGVLKPLTRLGEPDSRNNIFSIFDRAIGDWRPIVLAEHYQSVSAIVLNGAPPSDIREQFDCARNLIVYAWFVYEFSTPATVQIYTTIENALRRRADIAKNHPARSGLAAYFRHAVECGWLDDRAFTFLPRLPAWSNTKLRQSHRKGGQIYCDVLAKSMPSLRNSLAHGEPSLNTPNSALLPLEICVCIVDALFPKSNVVEDT